MNGSGLNLATRPFANERPVKRTTILIWGLALLLLALNVFLYQRHLSGQHEQREALASLQDAVALEETTIGKLEQYLMSMEIEQQNEKVRFLNAEIARRTFSWSRLFDRLEEVLPDRVRLHRVSPRLVGETRRGRRGAERPVGDLVQINLSGEAPGSDELLEFLDSLFEHPSFAVPNLMSESDRENNRLGFALNVYYLPAADRPEAAQPETSAVEEAALEGSVEGGSQ